MKYDLPIIHSRGGVAGQAGRIVFTIQMVQRCKLTVEVPSIQCAMRPLAHHTSQESQEAGASGGDVQLKTHVTRHM